MSEAHDPYEFRDDIKCPHCGVEDEEHADYPSDLKYDGDEVTVDCYACGKEFVVRLCCSYTYATEVSGPASPGPGKGAP